jgi:hypothetical protein
MSPRAKKPAKVSHETHLKWKGHGEKEERSSFLILCEGKTEEGYFSGMRSRRGPQIDVDVPKGDHVSAVREAVSRVSDDAVWCVLDTELNATLTTAMRREARKGRRRTPQPASGSWWRAFRPIRDRPVPSLCAPDRRPVRL